MDSVLDATPATALLQQARPSRLKRLVQRINVAFLFTVLIPTLAAAVYYGAIASDVYISESRFVVRSPQSAAPSGLGALLSGASLSRSSDDTYSVHEFVRSRDALRELDKKLNVRTAYSSKTIDIFSRFPGLDWDDSFEAFHIYYQKRALIDYDSTSSISVLRVRAYAAEDALKINEVLLQMGERMVNTLNLRGRQDLIASARQEVKSAEENAKTAALALSSFRAERSVFDPSGQSALQLQAVARLEQELMATEAQLSEVRRVSPDNPQIGSLVHRADGLRKAVATETAKVTGGRTSLSAKAPAFDRLVLEKTFADRQLGSALAALETARAEAQRKQLYLVRLVQPSLPDMAMEPRRIRSVFTVFVLGLFAWGVVSLIFASVREHVD